MTSTPLTVLDLVPISSGSTAAQALRNSIDLAQQAEGLGYTRYWFAEHHLNPGVAGTSPAVTSTHFGIRIDSAAPTSVTATMTYNAPGRWNTPNKYSAPAAMAPPTIVPPSSPKVVSREFTRTRSIVGGSTRGVTALRSTLNDLDSTIIPSAHGYSTQDG